MPHSLRQALLPALLLLGLSAPAATAQNVSTTASAGRGETILRFDQATARALVVNKVQVGLRGTARLERDSGIRFPVTGGRVDPATLRGALNHSGVLVIRRGGRSVALRSLRVSVGARNSVVSAQVGRTRITVFRLNVSRAKLAAPDPFTRAATGIRATLAAPAAKALNRAFGVKLFKGGLKVGSVRTTAGLDEAIVSGGETSLVLDPSTAQALAGLGIAAGPSGAARTATGGVAFPVTGGRVTAAPLAGTITHGGGLALTRGSTRVEISDYVVGLDDTPGATALIGGQRVEALGLDLTGLQRSADGSTLVLGGVVARLSAAAAGALNQAFGTDAFGEGTRLGTLTVRAATR